MYAIVDNHDTVLAGPFTSWKFAACLLVGIRQTAPNAHIVAAASLKVAA